MMSRPIIKLLAALATAGAVAMAVPAASAAAGYVPHRCYVSDLAAGFHGSQAGLGNRGFILTLTDVSGISCSLRGYLRLGLRNAADQPLPTRTLRGGTYFDPGSRPGQASRLVVLSPGETASADISFGVNGGRAHSVLASYLAITPPGGHRPFVLRIPSGPAPVWLGQVEVTAMARHTPYYP